MNSKKSNKPIVNLGNLDGPEGNAFVVIGKVASSLYQNGFYHEAKEFPELFMNWNSGGYDNGLIYVEKFCSLPQEIEETDEDEEYIYLRIKKNSIKNEKPILEDVKFYNCEHVLDYKIDNILWETNIYNRNFLFYLDDKKDDIVDALLNEATVDNLFNKDCFDSLSIGSSNSNKIIFKTVKRMLELDKNKFVEMAFLNDDFERNFFTKSIFNIDKTPQDKVFFSCMANLFKEYNIKLPIDYELKTFSEGGFLDNDKKIYNYITKDKTPLMFLIVGVEFENEFKKKTKSDITEMTKKMVFGYYLQYQNELNIKSDRRKIKI